MQGSWWAALAVLSATACAGGSGGGESPPPMIQMTVGQSDTLDETTQTTLDESNTGDASTTSGASPDTSTSDPGTTGESSTSESSSEGGSMPCSNAGSCDTATVLGIVSGDEPSRILRTTGTEPMWLTFRVTENNDGLSGESLSFQATLTSPPGYDFDLYAFRGSDGGTTGCGGVADESTAVGALDVVAMSWGEGGVANGGDESAWVAVQIDVKNGMCDPTAEWTLEVEGDI